MSEERWEAAEYEAKRLSAALVALVHRVEDNGQYVVGGESVLRSELAEANRALRAARDVREQTDE
jgi:hypothetical protein